MIARFAWIALIGPGCAYRVAIDSRPAAALVELPDGSRLTTPAVARVRWAPWNQQVIQVSATGYRTVSLDLRRREVRFKRFLFRVPRGLPSDRDALRARGRVELVLVPAHGPTGTWTEADIPTR